MSTELLIADAVTLVECANEIGSSDPCVTNAFAALRDSQNQLGELFDEVFNDFESLSREIESRDCLLNELRARTAEQVAELAALREAEVQIRLQLNSAEQQVESAKTQAANSPAETNQLREQLHAVELERVSLETELEALRIRTAELVDHLAEVKKAAADERIEWSSELQQLRRTLERQAELLSDRLLKAATVERPAAPATSTTLTEVAATNPTEKAPSPSPPSKDKVLGSVMAQFEMLQRDRQRRRGPPA